MDTMLLDLDNWDLTVDAAGNWAVASAPYALAQDVASEVKTFQVQDGPTDPIEGECWYDTTIGIPYFAEILGHSPPVTLYQEYNVQAALRVPGVVSNPPPQLDVTGFTDRGIRGNLTFTDTEGNQQTVQIQ